MHDNQHMENQDNTYDTEFENPNENSVNEAVADAKQKKTKGTELDLTNGNPFRLILIFSLPILAGNIFQQFYNIVDAAIVGHVLGDNALAAVGAVSAIYFLVVGFTMGMTNGFSIVISKLFGAKDYDTMRKAFGTSIYLSAIISVIVAVISILGVDALLNLINTPANILSDAKGYIVVIMAFVPVTMAYNLLGAILRGIGDSKTPLLFLIIASFVNVALDFLFISGFHWGVPGAAYATAISQTLSAVLCIIYIKRRIPMLELKRSDMKWDSALAKELFSLGFSMGMMMSVVSIGTVALQTAINDFGNATITAHVTARKIGEIFMMPLGTLGMATATFVSQNLGAGKLDRIRLGMKESFKLGLIWSLFALAVVLVSAKYIVLALTGTSNDEIIRTAVKYLYINLPFYFPLSILLTVRNTLQGLGRKVVPLISSTIELVSKFVVVGMLAPTMGYLGVCISEPIIWIICAIVVVVDYQKAIKKLYNPVEPTAPANCHTAAE